MSQVLVQTPPAAFYFALSNNARRRPYIAAACSTGNDIIGRVAKEFWRRNPARDRIAGQEPHQARLDRFYRLHCHVRIATDCNDHQGGFIVLGGELLGLHNIKAGTGDWLMRAAVELGADRLDTFDIPHLINLYQRHGFTEVLREKNHISGQPDVVWMRKIE